MEKKKPQTNFATLCAQATMESRDLYTLHRIMNRVTPKILPVTLTSFVFFTIHSGGIGEFSLDKKIVDPAANEVLSVTGVRLYFENGEISCRHVWRINNLEFKEGGRYSFVALLDGEIVAVCPFDVVLKS